MSKSTTQAVTDIIRIGHNSAYQIMCRTLRNGQLRYSFKHGLFWINPNGNIPAILHTCDLGNYDEQTKTRVAAKKHLEKIVVQQAPNQPPVQIQVVPQATANQTALPQEHPQQQIPQQQYVQPTPQGQAQWQRQPAPQQPQPMQPPKPYPSDGQEY